MSLDVDVAARWRSTERIRLLQRLQLAMVAAIAIAIVVTSVVMGHRVLSIGDARERAVLVRRDLIDLRDRIRTTHARLLSNGISGADLEITAAKHVFDQAKVQLQGLTSERAGMPAERRAIDQMNAAVADLDRVLTADATGIVAGGGGRRAAARSLDATTQRVEKTMSRWLRFLDADASAKGHAGDVNVARAVTILGSLVALLVGLGIALWFAIDRARRAEVAEIAAERDATAAVIGSVQDGLAVLDGDGRVVDVNEQLTALVGRSRDELIGTEPPWAEFLPGEFEGEIDLEVPDADARTRSVSLTSSVLSQGHLASGHVHVLKDVGARRRAEAEIRELAVEQEVLRRVATVVASGAEPNEVFDLVAQEVALLLGVEVGVVSRFDAIGERTVDVGVWVAPDSFAERPPARVPLDGGAPIARVHRTGRPARVDDLRTIDEKTAGLLLGHGFRGGVAAPVQVGATRWGAVVALTIRERGLPSRAEDRLARFAELVGLTVANADARARLASQAATDPLTGLANHRSFHERLEAEVARATAEDGELALVVFDLDRFKDVNDAFGHQIGDDVLAEAARRLAGEARFGELVARVGGEEFAWILPGSDGINAWRAAERARRAVAASPFGGDVGYVTASAGVADLTQAGDAAALLRLADGALYWAKANGRNVTLRYSPEVVQELSATERAERLARSQGVTALRALARAVDAKDPSTARHAERVAAVAVRLGSRLGWSQERLMLLEEAALLHDVGKVGVPDALLFKPDLLTDDERRLVETHAALGAEIVSDVLTAEQVAWVRGHHEHWDGAGYPDRLSGDAIAPGGRILAVADAWDAMTSVRVYGTPRDPLEALAEVERCSGGQFAPEVVGALQRLWTERRLTLTDAPGVVV